ncbi:hypothetical protein C1H46_013692 [Malus baccata]|uniref:non-specific serine/threonine protein kinase n=1 Tax=Malus baccata TaxID=106549 RepID=A0A540MR85_MALBA|nr:hypothetical protein C1H46_013692 [Malus baccata]
MARFLIMFTLIFCFSSSSTVKIEAQSQSDPKEVETLKEIAKQIGKKDWNFSIDPCINDTNWATPKSANLPHYNNTVICNCSTPDGFCHVVSIFLMGQDLAGVVPPSIAKLPYLKKVDFSQNYLSGTIPREWASTKLEVLSINVNNLSGPIPGYLGYITSLKYMNLQNNMLSGTVPHELGKLVNLNNLILNENYLTGELPGSLTKLTELTELRISSNSFTGKIPDYFQSWKHLQKLEIQASGFQGPIPSSISVLSNLKELRISDIKSGGSKFPPLSRMTNMQRLMLRRCNLYGPIPAYMAAMTNLKILDLSFNRLEGNIPDMAALSNLQWIYLTSNLLTGSIPDWIKLKNTRTLSGGCLETFSCPKEEYSLHINCGGSKTTIGGIIFEEDQDLGGDAKFVPVIPNWGISSTGLFWDVNTTAYDYIANNMSILEMNNSELYTSARLSPLSLTYYARCLGNGNYTVKLHFSEIIIRGNKSFYSFGRRIFDVYIQEKLVWKDFDIEKEAHGVDRVVIKELKAVHVKDRTLLIRFHWSGKGTTTSPKRGTYGPLISAISVDSDFKPPLSSSKSKMPIVVGTAVGASVVCLIFLTLGILWWRCCPDSKTSREKGNTLSGSKFKRSIGVLVDGTIIAVKQLSSKSKQGNREFVNEIGMISALHHPNLVRLYGCCIESNQLLLVYEYMENNSLAHTLFGPEEGPLKLGWPTREKICIGIARGLAFLHEESALKVVHRDIKTTNILLDQDLNAKISDFGLAKLDDEENTHISTRVAGTMLGSDFDVEEVITMVKVALLCINPAPALRPTMSEVVSMLEGRTPVCESVMNPSIYGDELRLASLRNPFDPIAQQSTSETQSLVGSSDATLIHSSATTSSDLYKIGPSSSTLS